HSSSTPTNTVMIVMMTITRLFSSMMLVLIGPAEGCIPISHGLGVPRAWAGGASAKGAIPATMIAARSRRKSCIDRSTPLPSRRTARSGSFEAGVFTPPRRLGPSGAFAPDQGLARNGCRAAGRGGSVRQMCQGEQAEWRHRRNLRPRVVLGLEQRGGGKIGMPAQRARGRGERTLDPPSRTGLGGEVIDEQQMPAGPHHPAH